MATDNSEQPGILSDEKLREGNPQRLSLLINSYFTDTWSPANSEQWSPNDPISPLDELSPVSLPDDNSNTRSEHDHADHDLLLALEYEKSFQHRDFPIDATHLPSPNESNGQADTHPASPGVHSPTSRHGEQKTVDVHLALSYAYQDMFVRQTLQDHRIDKEQVEKPADMAIREPAHEETVAMTDEQKTIDEHLRLSYVYEKLQRSLDATLSESSPDEMATAVDEQTTIDQHLHLSYVYEEEFLSHEPCKVVHEDEMATASVDEQATADDHLGLSYLYEALFDDLHAMSDPGQTTNDDEVPLTRDIADNVRTSDVMPRIIVSSEGGTEVELGDDDDSYGRNAFDVAWDEYAWPTDQEVREIISKMETHPTPDENDGLADMRQQSIVDSHLMLSYLYETEFIRGAVHDQQPTANENDNMPDIHSQSIVDSHLMLSYLYETEFIRGAVQDQQPTADENDSMADMHQQSIVDRHLMLSYLYETEFLRVAEQTPTPAADEQSIVDSHLMLSYRYEGEFLQAGAVQGQSRAADENDSMENMHQQSIVDSHLMLSYLYETEFLRVAEQTPSPAADEQSIVDSHLMLSYRYEGEFLQAGAVQGQSRAADENDSMENMHQQSVVDSHLMLSYLYETEFLRAGAVQPQKPTADETNNMAEQSIVDSHLRLSYLYEKEFLRADATQDQLPAPEEKDSVTDMHQTIVDSHLMLSYLYETEFLRIGTVQDQSRIADEYNRIGEMPIQAKGRTADENDGIADLHQQAIVDKHLVLSYLYETEFLHAGTVQAQKELPRPHSHMDLGNDSMTVCDIDEDLWLFNNCDSRDPPHSADASFTSEAGNTTMCDETSSQEEVAPFVVFWTEEVKHLTVLSNELREGRGGPAWKAYLGTPVKDESVEVMREHIIARWGGIPNIEAVDELIIVMKQEISALLNSGKKIDTIDTTGASDTTEPVTRDLVRANESRVSELNSQVAELEAQQQHILSYTSEVTALLKTLGLESDPPMQPATNQLEELVNGLSTLVTKGPALIHALHDTRKRLAARDTYLNTTLAASAREMHTLHESLTELQLANQELSDELLAERRGRRCVERELLRIEGTSRSQPASLSASNKTKPQTDDSLTALMNEFKKMGERLEKLEHNKGLPPKITSDRPKMQMTKHHLKPLDKLLVPTPPTSPHRRPLSASTEWERALYDRHMRSPAGRGEDVWGR
ncbi:hypothetical protein DFJ77DRAFT_541098 [Powellomyces hirtus]|nr:hypothetical protein DFJ77DRAFT_541098 [Powellomyces hirtus]